VTDPGAVQIRHQLNGRRSRICIRRPLLVLLRDHGKAHPLRDDPPPANEIVVRRVDPQRALLQPPSTARGSCLRQEIFQAEPAVNMCFPPLSWQTYDIDFKAAKYDDAGKKTDNARITIKHNGVVIHDNLELTKGTPGYKAEGLEQLGLFLQNHSNPVAFRNIWGVEK